MIYIWNLDAKIKMKMDKNITTNFARSNKRFVANAELQCGVCRMPYEFRMDAMQENVGERERTSHYYADAVAMRVFQNEALHTMLPITSAGVDSAVFGGSSRHFAPHNRRPNRKKKPSELFNYIFMCMRLISMSADDERERRCLEKCTDTECTRRSDFRVSMSTCVLRYNTHTHIAHYDHVNFGSFAHYYANFLSFIMAARHCRSSFHFHKMQISFGIFSIESFGDQRYTSTCEKASAPAPAATYQVLFLLHFLTLFSIFIICLLHSSQHHRRSITDEHVFFPLQFYFALVFSGETRTGEQFRMAVRHRQLAAVCCFWPLAFCSVWRVCLAFFFPPEFLRDECIFCSAHRATNTWQSTTKKKTR